MNQWMRVGGYIFCLTSKITFRYYFISYNREGKQHSLQIENNGEVVHTIYFETESRVQDVLREIYNHIIEKGYDSEPSLNARFIS